MATTSVRDSAATSTDTTSPNYSTASNKSMYSTNSPNVREPFSPLQSLAYQALRRYGDMHAGTVSGDVLQMFVDFANLVVEDLRQHPYWAADGINNLDIDYYKHYDETREIPDPIVVAGLLRYYSEQQMSEKLQLYGPQYAQTMNRILYNRKYGHQKVEMQAVDKRDKVKVGTTDKVDPLARWGV